MFDILRFKVLIAQIGSILVASLLSSEFWLVTLCPMPFKTRNPKSAMTKVSTYLTETEAGVVLRVHVQTRASRDEIVGSHGDLLKVRITAAPIAGEANKHLLKFLAKKLKISQGQLSIKSGATSKKKSISILGISGAEVRERFLRR